MPGPRTEWFTQGYVEVSIVTDFWDRSVTLSCECLLQLNILTLMLLGVWSYVTGCKRDPVSEISNITNGIDIMHTQIWTAT